ncbi:hypothetical protein [Chitinibacter bivalviorum]|nr:hypothetical protein [Chitinibacter bivalviorum]
MLDSELAAYVNRQLEAVYPDGDHCVAEVASHIAPAKLRLMRCINEVKLWEPNKFNYLHSSQYCIFLYYLSNQIWRSGGSRQVCEKLFGLNKMLNGIDLFFEVEMPEVFFIGHSVGIVLAKASYSNYLVLYQNSTVGKNHGIAPVLESGVVMYPNTAIIGRSHIGKNAVISQGVGVVNQNIPADSLVFSGSGQLLLKKAKHNVLADIFRM